MFKNEKRIADKLHGLGSVEIYGSGAIGKDHALCKLAWLPWANG